jgi:hypothetical protein
MKENNSKKPIEDICFKSRGKSIAENAFITELTKRAYNKDKSHKALLFAFKDFSPYQGDFVFNHLCRIESKIFPPADLIFLSLASILGCSYAGKFEKIAWSIAFSYKTVPFAFSLQKFGLRLFRHKKVPPKPAFVEEMLRALIKAIGIIGTLFEPIALEQIKSGNVTLANSFVQLDNMYFYFRKEAKKNFILFSQKSKTAIDDIGEFLSRRFKRMSAGNYNAYAMIDAFFSRLEQLLLLLLPFMNYNRIKHDLVHIMNSFWSEKFKIIFNLNTDFVAKKLYDQMNCLREKHRNPVSHGNFQKNGKSFFFHFPMGVISCHLSCINGDRSHSILKLDKDEFNRICELFDEIDNYIETGPSKYGFRYAKSGLAVAFDEKSLCKYKAAAVDDESFIDFIELESKVADMNANMDW